MKLKDGDRMKYENKRYFAGALMIFLQFLLFEVFGFIFTVDNKVKLAAFLIFIFFYFTEDIYSFRSYLIWEELRKQVKCFIEFVVMMTIVVALMHEVKDLWKYYVLAIIAFPYSIFIVKILRKVLVKFMEKNLVIIGTGQTAMELLDTINKNEFTMYNFLGFLGADNIYSRQHLVEEDLILGDYDKFDYDKVDEVIIAIPNLTNKLMKEIVDKLDGKVKKIKFVPKIRRMYTFSPKTQDYDGVMLVTAQNLIGSRKRRIIKRAMDICFGIAGMLVLIPLSIVVWFKTDKKDREGGIFYSQDRIGQNGEAIKIYKYRSMVHGAEQILKELMERDPAIREEYTVNKKLRNDPRITKIGEFLRRTSLDEFPQFWNVLKGEMSFIGPRPYLFGEKEDMGDSYDKIVEFKPGITGMWQTHGRSDTDFNERLELDEYYYRNWSIWLDMIILVKTVKNVVAKDGAY